MKLEKYWYQPNLHPLLVALLPFSLAFGLGCRLRRWSYRLGINKTQNFSTPVIVVGNISVGGTGKTPFVIWLAELLKSQGKKPGIALRGVGGQKNYLPIWVEADSNPLEAGDEAVLLAKSTRCLVAACINRPLAVQKLIDAGCDVILCDDGLQHYALGRQMEIAIIDGSRLFGNGLLLPAGPLREWPARLNEVDFIVVNEPSNNGLKRPHHKMRIKAEKLVAVHNTEKVEGISALAGKKVHAVAGIGNPQRFFDFLKGLDLDVIPHEFPDHYAYQSSDLAFGDEYPVIMTEKDAVKCKGLGFDEAMKGNQWYLQVSTEVSDELQKALLSKLGIN